MSSDSSLTGDPGTTGHADCVDALEQAMAAYVDSIGRGDGHNEDRFLDLSRCFEKCAERWASEEFVPRTLAHLCMSIPFGILALAGGYTGQSAEEIEVAAAKLDSLSMKVVPWESGSSENRAG